MRQTMTRRKMLAVFGGIIGMIFTKNIFAVDPDNDGITSATVDSSFKEGLENKTSRVLMVLVSLHHKNTEKIANEMAKVLNAPIETPQEITPEDLLKYRLVGFGSGIYDQKHHQTILDLVDKLPEASQMKVFIYSTSGVSRKTCLDNSMPEPHAEIRNKLLAKGCEIIGEFNCTGWNTNSFLKLFGGINKGKPNANDLLQARKFAEGLMV